MIKIDIPGRGPVNIHNVIFDYNGTLALDGKPAEGLKEAFEVLAGRVNLYIVTADTFGTVKNYFKDIPVKVVIINSDCGKTFKKNFLTKLGSEKTVAVGNGRNDAGMLKESCLGIGIIGPEGCFAGIVNACDILVTSPVHAIGLLLNPDRIKATLRY